MSLSTVKLDVTHVELVFPVVSLVHHKEISQAPSTSQTKCAVQQGKVCLHGVLDCGLGPSLVARTVVKKNRQPELTVLKQGAERQHISLSFMLESLKESEMNAKCKQQHSLSAGVLLLASKLSIQVVYFF